jgi:hypothetical protein
VQQALELFRATGLWNAFEDWKRKVTQIANEEAAASGAAQPFPLWDFSGYNPATIEDVPAPGDLKSEMWWYSLSRSVRCVVQVARAE